MHSRFKHGYAPLHGKRESVYKTWQAIHKRCGNKNDKRYKCYGGRGIKVCRRWSGENGFVNFLADMGKPAPGMSLERKDNDKGYCPSNCCWIPHCDQAKNRKYNWQILCDGEILTAREAGERAGIKKQTITSRLNMHPRFKKTDIIPIEALMIKKYAKGAF